MATTLDATVRKLPAGGCAIDIQGDVTAESEAALMEAFTDACQDDAQTVLLNFERLEYMNSGGIGLLVTLMVRASRQGQRLAATGLSDHYRQIFELTRLDEAITILEREDDLLSTEHPT